jgi:hypothetical protein
MIRQLAQCPFCRQCEIALDDHPEVTFNPGTTKQPCEHLVWVDGRYSEWAPGSHGVNRIIGSTEFHWDHPDFAGFDRDDNLTDYLRELVRAGKTWEFAPVEPFEICSISGDQKVVGARGKEYTRWDVDGSAVFAVNSRRWVALLPDCQANQLAGLKVRPNEGGTG